MVSVQTLSLEDEPPLLQGESIVYFGPEPWHGLWRNRQQLMSRFAKHNRVLYVEPPLYSVRKIMSLLSSEQWEWASVWPPGVEKLGDGLFVLRSPIWLPLLGKHPVNQLKYAYWQWILRRTARKLRLQRPIVWLSRPLMGGMLGVLDEKLSIYHVVDEYTAYDGVTHEQRDDLLKAEAKMLRQTDVSIVVSRSLLKHKAQMGGNVHLVPNAVDFSAYAGVHDSAAIPNELLEIERPWIGYSGLIGRRLDLELIAEVARKRPRWSFVMLGPVRKSRCETALSVLETLPNVHFLEQRPVDEVPGFVRAFDVCMVPYRQDERSVNSSPLKIYEYAAAGRPIVATRFPVAEELNDFVLIAEEANGFEHAISEALGWEASHPRLRAGVETARQNTWERRISEVSKIILDTLETQGREKARGHA